MSEAIPKTSDATPSAVRIYGSAPSLFVRHAPFGSGSHVLDVLVQRAARRLERRCLPRLAALGELGLRDLDVDLLRLRVDVDGVPVAHERNRAAHLRLGRDVTDQEAVRAAS